MAAGGGTKAVLAAMIGNAIIAMAKFAGFLITGSSSMISESIHSVADSGNQALLLLGGRTSKRAANATHQFGYGRERYFWSFVVALILFALGSAFSLYHGIEKTVHALDHPDEMVESLNVAIYILVFSIIVEVFSFRMAIIESRPLKGSRSWWNFIRRARTPELPVVLLEDLGALCGLVIALVALLLSQVTNNPVFDGIGSIAIGLLLGAIAVILIIEMRSLLIGEGGTKEEMDSLQKIINGHPSVDRLVHLKTQYFGPNQMLVAAKVCLPSNLSSDQVSVTINEIEDSIRNEIEHANPIYLEPDLEAGQ